MSSRLYKYELKPFFSCGEREEDLYLYNEKGNVIEARYYIGGYEIFRKETNNTFDFERTTLNISDDAKVFVRIEQKTNENEVVRYLYDNHLGNACLELDDAGQIISYEEYHLFGSTSYRSGRCETEVSLKRYKYNGKERDEETGLYAYGMRYYAAWLGRFISVDPMKEKYPELSTYCYCVNNPIKFIDPDGRLPKKVNNVWFTEISKYKNIRPTLSAPANFTETATTSALNTASIRYGSGSAVLRIKNFTETAKSNNLPNVFDYTINTQQYSIFSMPKGYTVYNSKIVAGKSSPDFYYASLKDGKFTFGQGDVPTDSDFGVGGGIPIIINGKKYSGTKDSEGFGYFKGYADQNFIDKGKSIFAYNSTNGNIMLISQQDGVKGMTMDEIRDYIFDLGYDNAISFDGSGSATFVQDNTIIVSPDWYRVPLIPTGMTVSEEPSNQNFVSPFIRRREP